jgi:hypothetical protein
MTNDEPETSFAFLPFVIPELPWDKLPSKNGKRPTAGVAAFRQSARRPRRPNRCKNAAALARE